MPDTLCRQILLFAAVLLKSQNHCPCWVTQHSTHLYKYVFCFLVCLIFINWILLRLFIFFSCFPVRAPYLYCTHLNGANVYKVIQSGNQSSNFYEDKRSFLIYISLRPSLSDTSLPARTAFIWRFSSESKHFVVVIWTFRLLYYILCNGLFAALNLEQSTASLRDTEVAM